MDKILTERIFLRDFESLSALGFMNNFYTIHEFGLKARTAIYMIPEYFYKPYYNPDTYVAYLRRRALSPSVSARMAPRVSAGTAAKTSLVGANIVRGATLSSTAPGSGKAVVTAVTRVEKRGSPTRVSKTDFVG